MVQQDAWLERRAINFAAIMGMPLRGPAESDFYRMPPSTVQHAPSLPLSNSRFIPGPAVVKSANANEGSIQEQVRGSNLGGAPSKTNFSGPPDNCGLPGHLPSAIGSAAP
eukprot:1126807-Pyramimonas_sp.AAC.2